MCQYNAVVIEATENIGTFVYELPFPLISRTMKFVLRLLKWIFIAFFAGSILATLVYKFVPVPGTPLMLIRCVQQFGHGERITLKHKWVPLDSISPYLPIAVIAAEDQNYLLHHGFDLSAIRQAYEEQKNGKRLRGGSTISQQTAKNVFLWPTSSWARKGLEVYFTALIELLWSKERIMEVYLNSIEMGPGIYGAEAVAMQHFGCHARELKRSECALIAATLPNPLKFSSFRPSPYMRKRQRKISREMKHIPFPEFLKERE